MKDDLAIESSSEDQRDTTVEGCVLDRQLQIQILLDHYEKPRHRGALDDADVTMPGGNPGCGDVVTVYLKAAIRKYQKDRLLEKAGVTRPEDEEFVFGEHAAESARKQ